MDDVDASRVKLQHKMGLSRVLSKIPIRVSITGTRGKSSQSFLINTALNDRGLWAVAKITGDVPFFIDKNGTYNILRKSKHPVFLDETAFISSMCDEANGFPDAVILENQAIQTYTMYAFYELYSRPNYLIVTNIRKDHQEFLGRTRSEIATSYGRSFARARRVISGDQNEETNEILARHARKIDAKFHTVEVPAKHRVIPGAENVYVAQKFLELASEDFPDYGDLRMKERDVESYVNAIDDIISLHPSSTGIEWFDGAKLNDIDSTEMVLEFLKTKHPDKSFAILAYFRGDRPARTITFAEYFNRIKDDDRFSAVYMVGTGAEYVYDRLDRSKRDKFHVLGDTTDNASKVLRRIERENTGLITVANAVSPFMRHVRKSLLAPSQRHTVYQKVAEEPTVVESPAPELIAHSETFR